MTKRLWVLDAGNSQVLNVDPTNGNSNVLANGFPAGATLNALTFDAGGNGYVTDSTNGSIYRIPRDGGSFNILVDQAPLLKPLGDGNNLRPPFGANGIELSPPGCDPVGSAAPRCGSVFVANTANRNIIQFLFNSQGNIPGLGFVFINGINAPDGIAIDNKNNIWVCANQEDEIVVISQASSTRVTRVIAKLGDFDGIDSQGRVKGLLFPSSLAFSHDQQHLYVANLASPNQQAIDSAWARQVTTFTVSKIVVPNIPDTGLFK
jgi:sugar lactone lactonase YvrE